MTKTENYNLNQWESTDPIRREDFNADNAAIDAALGALSGRKRVVTGSYIGDGTTKHTIPLEFTPQFVLVVSEAGEKPYLLIATPGMGLTFNGSSFALSDSRCVENGFYVAGNANYSKVGNYYLAAE